MSEYRDPRQSAPPPVATGSGTQSGPTSPAQGYGSPNPQHESAEYGASAGFSEPVLGGSAAVPSPSDAPATHEQSTQGKAAESAQAGKQAAGEVAQTATDNAKDVAREAKVQARNVVGQAQDQLRQQAATQHRNLVGNLRALGDQLNSMADGSDQTGTATDLVGEAGSRAHSAASWLDPREPGQLLDELRSFARRKPGVFLLGALAGGVLAGRLTRGAVAAHGEDGNSGSSTGYGDTQPSAYSTGGAVAEPAPTEVLAPGTPYSSGYPTVAPGAEPATTRYPTDPGVQP